MYEYGKSSKTKGKLNTSYPININLQCRQTNCTAFINDHNLEIDSFGIDEVFGGIWLAFMETAQ